MASESRFRLSFAVCPLLAVLAGAPASRAEGPPQDGGGAKSVAAAPADKDRKGGKGGKSPMRYDEDVRDREQRETTEHMRRLLSMNDAQIGRMRDVLAALEKIPPEKRAELLRRLDSLRRATPDERDAFIRELREKYGIFEEHHAKPRDGGGRREGGLRNLMEKHFSSFPTPEAADAERRRFLAMSREEKLEYIRRLREKYGLPEDPRGDAKRKPDGDKPAPDGRTAAAAPKPPAGDPFGV